MDVIIQALRGGTAFSLCDGSYKLQHGTAGFVLQGGSSATGRILGCHCTPGHPLDQNSFRSEVGGLLAIILLANRICADHHILHGGIEVACDCQSALTVIFEHEWTNPTQPSYDLITAARQAIHKSPLAWKWRHIKGHQDRYTTFDRLDWRSQLNVEVDQLAKTYWNHTYSSHQVFYDDTPGQWRISIGSRQLSHLDRQFVYESIHGPPLQSYWKKRKDLSQIAIDTIDWEVCDQGIRRLPLFQQLWLAKMNTNTASTGQILHMRGHQTTPNCPRCGQFEDVDHVLRCPSSEARGVWHRNLLSLQTWMTRQSTQEDISHAIITNLQRWYTAESHPSDSTVTPDLSLCISSQASIGWNSFLFGFLSRHWAITQQAYYESISSQRTGLRWSCLLFKQLISIPWKLWNHRCQERRLPTSLSQIDEHRHLNALIRDEYQRGTLGWRHRDRRWLSRPLESLLDDTLTVKSAWLHSVSIVRERNSRRQLTPHAQEQRTLLRFLTHHS